MKAVNKLPDGYVELCSLDLQKDKKTSFIVNFLACVIAVVMIVAMNAVVPISNLFSVENGNTEPLIKAAAILVLTISYLILHELVHGIAMKICGTKKVKYGFTGLYAFAGSEDYYGKRAYIFIALAPIVLWGVVIAIINSFVENEWFWIVYLIQVINVSGAAGDLFVTIKLSRFPKDILIKDCGVKMDVYSTQKDI